jgi:hypothetical protein
VLNNFCVICRYILLSVGYFMGYEHVPILDQPLGVHVGNGLPKSEIEYEILLTVLSMSFVLPRPLVSALGDCT